MVNQTPVDWLRERDALLDMSVTASRSHLVAAQALWNAMATDGETLPAPGDQKILAAKLAAEGFDEVVHFAKAQEGGGGGEGGE